jgi:TolB protein
MAVDELLPTRDLKPGQRTEVWIADGVGGAPELVYTSDELLLEAPNWAPDANSLLLNGHGLLWSLTLEPEVTLEQVMIDDLPPINKRPRPRRATRADLPLRQ